MAISQILPHLILLLPLAILAVHGGDTYRDDCKPRSCKNGGPEVRFPFWLKDHHKPICGHPGFELKCSKNSKQTLLDLPISAQFTVKRIDYKARTIRLQDPQTCLARQLPKLDLTSTPFGYFMEDNFFYNFDRYVFFNCTSSASNDPHTIHCLGGSGVFVKAFPAGSPARDFSLATCRRIDHTLPLPTALVEFQKDHVFLNWSAAPRCRECEARSRGCRFKAGSSSSPQAETECFDFPKQGLTEKLVTTGAILGSFLLVLTPIGLYHLRQSYILEKQNEIKIKQFLEDYKALKSTRYSYADIKRITNHLKQKLGQGGYGTVYKGKLSNNILVAVKILNHTSAGNGEEFINEVGAMGRIHHVNVARLVGFCADGPNRALVYEFLPNASLEKFIFADVNEERVVLGWEKIRDIALGIAKGMEYLHHGCEQQILHFDIKPHNILLDHNLVPKISDFGLAKLCSKEKSVVTMTAARGTVGYIAPEVASRNFGKPSAKSDVYSFGMLLLEMVGGRRNVDFGVEETSQVYFPEWVYKHMDQGGELGIEIEEGYEEIVKKLTIVALKCIQWFPIDRPCMKGVVQMLEGDGESLTMPPNPFSSLDGTMELAVGPARSLRIGALEIISEAE